MVAYIASNWNVYLIGEDLEDIITQAEKMALDYMNETIKCHVELCEKHCWIQGGVGWGSTPKLKQTLIKRDGREFVVRGSFTMGEIVYADEAKTKIAHKYSSRKSHQMTFYQTEIRG